MTESDNVLVANYASTHPVYSHRQAVETPGRKAHLVRMLSRCLPKNREVRLLDLGCGDGALLCVARGLGVRRLKGVDLSEEMAFKARALGFDVQCRDAVSFLGAQPAGSFDVICAFDVLEHLDLESLLRLCENVHRVLDDRGVFLVHVPNGASPYVGRIRYGDITHERAFTRESLQQVLRASGFKSIGAEEDEPVVRSVASFVRFCLWKVLRLAIVLRVAVETGVLTGHLLTLNIIVTARKP